MRSLALLLCFLVTSAIAGETCIETPPSNAQADAQSALAHLYSDATLALESFPSLLETLIIRSPGLCYASRLDGAHGYLDADRNRIYVSPELPRDMQMGVLLHEIRHLDQLWIGACPSDDLAMTDYARATFAMEADASAISLLIAWHLKDAGDPGVWSALSAWETQTDIADRFAAEMAATGNIETAVAAAFDQWYMSDLRRSQYYLSTCSAYLDRQDATHALPQYQALSPDFYADLCKLPGGAVYECTEPDHALR